MRKKVKIVKENQRKPKLKIFTYHNQSQDGTVVWGRCIGNTILINEEILGNCEFLDAAILEELLHFISGHTDFTRDFQNFIIKTAIRGLLKGSNESNKEFKDEE